MQELRDPQLPARTHACTHRRDWQGARSPGTPKLGRTSRLTFAIAGVISPKSARSEDAGKLARSRSGPPGTQGPGAGAAGGCARLLPGLGSLPSPPSRAALPPGPAAPPSRRGHRVPPTPLALLKLRVGAAAPAPCAGLPRRGKGCPLLSAPRPALTCPPLLRPQSRWSVLVTAQGRRAGAQVRARVRGGARHVPARRCLQATGGPWGHVPGCQWPRAQGQGLSAPICQARPGRREGQPGDQRCTGGPALPASEIDAGAEGTYGWAHRRRGGWQGLTPKPSPAYPISSRQ